ncbi:uncharacterized protein LOC112694003 isoform X2 [Sipha flava]|nr:uncharacterized protein LOC112694003 isoform X2 [Sipha flava]
MIRWPDSSWYEGEFQKGLRHGRGMHVSGEDGRRWYGGQWTFGKRNGLGQSDCGTGESDGALNYDGHWVDGQPHGHGTGNWSDGTRYTGGWVRGRPHGRGKAVWPEDDVYEGDWVDGFMDGVGTYKWTSNPRDHNRLVIRSCDKYTGQWLKSKKHGSGEFYSAETGTKMRGNWSDDVLNGPCEIILRTGRRPSCSGLEFRRGVLYETSPPLPASRRTTIDRGHRIPSRTANRGVRLSVEPVKTASQSLCTPVFSGSAGNDDVQQAKGAAIPSPRLVRVNVPLTADKETACDLTGHVRRLVAQCSDGTVDTSCIGVVVDPELELRDAERAIEAHADQLQALYRAYGAFLAESTVVYRPLLTRLGLWQMLIDSYLHARISLADFDDLLCEYATVAELWSGWPYAPHNRIYVACTEKTLPFNPPSDKSQKKIKKCLYRFRFRDIILDVF